MPPVIGYRHEASDRPTVLGDGHLLPSLDTREQLGKVGLRLESSNGDGHAERLGWKRLVVNQSRYPGDRSRRPSLGCTARVVPAIRGLLAFFGETTDGSSKSSSASVQRAAVHGGQSTLNAARVTPANAARNEGPDART